jgi:thioredoxin reductase
MMHPSRGVQRRQTLIHRRGAFRTHERSVRLMREGPTRILVFHELKSISGDGRAGLISIYDNHSNIE